MDVLDGRSSLSSLSASHPSAGSSDRSDTLSEVLEAVRLTGALFFLVDASTPWVAEAPAATQLAPTILPRAQHIVSYHVVTQGACWCESHGHTPLRLETGDVLLVPHGHAYQLASTCGLRTGQSTDDALAWFRAMAGGQLPLVVTEGGDGPERLELVCGFLGCDALPLNPVLTALPALLRVRVQGDSSSRLSALLQFAVAESSRASPGSRSVLLRIAELVFVEVLRSYLTSVQDGTPSWLGGLRDPVVGRALARLHAEPARAWTLPELAREAGASRSVLAERFASFVGHPPMLYLTRWRMQLAAGLLAAGTASVSAVAGEVGYESEAAFCRAFKKVTGVTPASWRSRRAAEHS
ncbi:MAG TPA: AraC family transcriptional regulator [Vicinamibacterales bacterium]|nr:AraC family transcriptional regulator [Vicinamibacterales bacterium]